MHHAGVWIIENTDSYGDCRDLYTCIYTHVNSYSCPHAIPVRFNDLKLNYLIVDGFNKVSFLG